MFQMEILRGSSPEAQGGGAGGVLGLHKLILAAQIG